MNRFLTGLLLLAVALLVLDGVTVLEVAAIVVLLGVVVREARG